LLSAVTRKAGTNACSDELLGALEKVLTNEETLAALGERIRKELPALFTLTGRCLSLAQDRRFDQGFIQDARADPGIRCAWSSTVS